MTFLLGLGALTAGVARAGVLLNEVLYDPEGADAGREFVEIFNSGSEHVDLYELRLEFANGAVGEEWALRWTGAAGDSLAPGRSWLIVDRGWSGPADAETTLGLQNGPDALRLRRGDDVLDRLGWGALEWPALSEGTPHPGSGRGRSLARRPDGRDTDHNDLDWFATDEPTPGALNVRLHSLRVIDQVVEPPCRLRPDLPCTLRVILENDGSSAWSGGPLELRDAVGGTLHRGIAPSLAPADTLHWSAVWAPPDTGLTRPRLVTALAADSLSLDLRPVWTGVPDLTLREIMAAPESGAPEWIEVRAERSVDLAGWTLADDDDARALPDVGLATGERLVLCADAEAFVYWVAARRRDGAPWPCAVDPVARARSLPAGWPTLNNTASGEDTRADRLVLRRPDGVAVDRAAWGGVHPPAVTGRSLERVRVPPLGAAVRNWAASTAVFGSTPGCPNAVSPSARTESTTLVAEPELLPAGSGTTLSFRLHDGDAAWDLRVLSLTGRTERHLGGDALGPGSRTAVWDARDDAGAWLCAGPHLVLLRVRDRSGRLIRREGVVVVVDRGPS